MKFSSFAVSKAKKSPQRWSCVNLFSVSAGLLTFIFILSYFCSNLDLVLCAVVLLIAGVFGFGWPFIKNNYSQYVYYSIVIKTRVI